MMEQYFSQKYFSYSYCFESAPHDGPFLHLDSSTWENDGDISMQCVKDITDTSDTDQWTSSVLQLLRMGFVGKVTQTFWAFYEYS